MKGKGGRRLTDEQVDAFLKQINDTGVWPREWDTKEMRHYIRKRYNVKH